MYHLHLAALSISIHVGKGLHFREPYLCTKSIFIIYLCAKRTRHNIALRITCIPPPPTHLTACVRAAAPAHTPLLYRDIRGMPITFIVTSRCNRVAKTNAFVPESRCVFLRLSTFLPNFSSHVLLSLLSVLSFPLFLRVCTHPVADEGFLRP